MSDRIEGGNAITTITFSSDAPPEIATSPTDREIIAALVEALEGARAMLRRAHFVIEQLQNSETTTLSINAEIRAISAALKLAGA